MLLQQIDLIDAAQEAGVHRLVPCAWLPMIPICGIHNHGMDEQVDAHVKVIELPFTVVDDGWWYQIACPKLLSGYVKYALMSLPAEDLYGTGERNLR